MSARRRVPAASLALVLAAGAGRAAAGDGTAAEVAAWLSGTFDSKDQAAADPAGFKEIRLVTVPVPKSRIGLGAPVLYAEQAAMSTPDRPYRQRFYRIEEPGAGKILARVFEPKDPIAVSGKWREPSDLAVFGPNDFVERTGCLVTLRKIGDRYEGGTKGNGCPFALQGARYATTRLSLFADRVESWDRGFDASGNQVWGATKGAYLFVRRSANGPAPAPTPAPTATPESVGTILVRGIGTERTLNLSELRSLPLSTLTSKPEPGPGKRKKEIVWKGASLLEILRRCGLRTEGMPARRLLAPAVLLAAGADGYTAAFSVDELFDATNAPLLVFEHEGKPLDASEGPFRIASTSPIRAVRNVVSLELRLLATNPEEKPKEIWK